MASLVAELLGNRVRVYYTLSKSEGTADVKDIVDVLYNCIHKLKPVPEELLRSSSFSHCEEVIVPKADSAIIFVFESWQEKSTGPVEENMHGPYLKKGSALEGKKVVIATCIDVEGLSKETGATAEDIKTAWGIPLEGEGRIDTFELAYDAYSRTSKFSAEREAALRKMVELALITDDFKELSRLAVMQEMEERGRSDEKMKAIYSFALEKWSELSAKDVEHAYTLAGARKAYHNSPYDNQELKAKAFRKWLEFAETFEELQETYKASPDSETKKEATLKLTILFIRQ